MAAKRFWVVLLVVALVGALLGPVPPFAGKDLVQLQANIWYDAEIVLNGGEYIVRVWKQDTPGTVYERAETHSTWAGAAWKAGSTGPWCCW